MFSWLTGPGSAPGQGSRPPFQLQSTPDPGAACAGYFATCAGLAAWSNNQVTTLPPITISSRDAERLEKLLDSLPDHEFPGRAELEAELGRATVVDPREMPPEVVTMNSTVRFRVQDSAEEFRLTLVYPKDMDPSGKTISVLAPVGSALLGLTQGDEIEWPGPGGGTLRVRIEEVTYQPERTGEYHR